ncbi:MAG: cadherin-like domain-containing protein [Gemmataceae bacterium]|nr:cadherin-like domain-containing protein [Gemmataceae bacterium]
MAGPRTLQIETLEGRVVPVTWPVGPPPGGGPAQLLGTYGQYQEFQLTPEQVAARKLDQTKSWFEDHLHEGLDIAAPADSDVKAVMAGVVEAVYRDPTTPFYSFIVVRDATPGADGKTRGWNYKHVNADPRVSKGVRLEEGMVIGTVGQYPGTNGYGNHVHLDRGLAEPEPKGERLRDPTMANRAEYIAAKTAIQTATTEADRKAAVERREGLRWQYVTSINPLTEFTGQVNGGVVVADQIKPTIRSLDFRRNKDEKLVINVNANTQRKREDIARTTAHYFTTSAAIDTATYKRLGRYATGVNAAGDKTKPGNDESAKIDFVVSAYDQFGTPANPGTRLLNPLAFELRVAGREPNTNASDSGVVRSFDFSKATGPQLGINRFFNVANTGTFYETDKDHQSVMVPGAAKPSDPFYYVLTNSPNLELTAGNQPAAGAGIKLPGTSTKMWNTIAEKGHGLYWINDAAKNAAAAYPDGLYTVTVTARDLWGNPATLEEKVLLTNWQRTVVTDGKKQVYKDTEVVNVTGGEQYLASQQVKIYVLSPGQGNNPPADNTPLPADKLRGTVTTNGGGELTQKALGTFVAGEYYVVADYNGDGIYTDGLDAFIRIRVQGPSVIAPPPATVSITSSKNPAHWTEAVTFRADVSYQPGPNQTAGFYDFFDGTTYLGPASNMSAYATLQGVLLTPGTHEVTVYFSYPSYGWAKATLTQTVLPNTTNITLTSDRTTTNNLDQVQFTATVTAPWTPPPPYPGLYIRPTGAVKFFADGEEFASAPLDANGQVTVFYNELLRGSPVVTAEYVGDAVFEGSTSNSRTQVVLNNLPVLGADSVTTTVGNGARVVVWRNDSDIDGDVLTITGVSTPGHGTAALAADGSVNYTPAAGYTGNDSFAYTVSDGMGGTATTTVTVRVLPQWAGNRVFTDANANGVQDAGDVGIPFVLVRILNTAGVEVAAVLTDDNGYYTLPTTLPAGNYRLQFVLPNALPVVPFSPRDQGGDDARDSDVDATGTTGLIAFAPAAGWPDIDAGVVIDPTDPAIAYLLG